MVKEKQKRLRRGRALLRKKKKREQQEENETDEEDVEFPDMVTVRSSEWEEMKRTMQDTVARLAVCERALKRAAPNEDGGSPAKRARAPTIRDRYSEHPRLVNPLHFHNWWSQGLSKPILRLRAERELGNMRVPLVFLTKPSANVLSEVYCLFSSQLLIQGAIERLPIRVPKCYAHPGITH